MRIRSQIDLCLFIRVVDVPQTMITPALKKTLASVQYNKLSPAVWSKEALGSDIDDAIRIEMLFHESYHYWQGISYPYLIWYSFHAWKELVDGFRELVANKPLQDQQIEAKTLDRLNRRYAYISMGPRSFALAPVGLASPTSGFPTLSELDLIEAATSVAQWRLYGSDKTYTYPSFMLWTKRVPAYTKAFRLAADLFTDRDLILGAFPFLVAAAFSSTHPVRTFSTY